MVRNCTPAKPHRKKCEILTEDYALRNDGTIGVTTKGYNFSKQKWTEINGKIRFTGSPQVGMMEVSYFGPFYANYNVLDIDDDYRYALVSGSGLGYLWILSRETFIPEDIQTRFLKKARDIGFDITQLEWGVS